MNHKSKNRKIRYAVVGLGHIAQVAVLPAFKHAQRNSELVALVSDDPEKLRSLAKRYDIEHTFSYSGYGRCLESGAIDAVYIALPNHLHAQYTIRAAEAGIHVLCEKPMAVTSGECHAMIRAAEKNNVKLMIAYRLHFEEANLQAVELARSRKIGEPRLFSSVFSMQVRPGNIRTDKEKGGGTLYDIGIYCINAARYLFSDEPIEVFAFSSSNRKDPRFEEIDEMTGAVLRFPNERLATFATSFGASDVATYRIVGTRGDLQVEQAYEYAMSVNHYLTIKGEKRKRTFPKRDQFAPELIYFSDCINANKAPEPSGTEGLADVRIIEALYRSARIKRPVKVSPVKRGQRPTLKQEIRRPAVRKPPLVHVESATL